MEEETRKQEWARPKKEDFHYGKILRHREGANVEVEAYVKSFCWQKNPTLESKKVSQDGKLWLPSGYYGELSLEPPDQEGSKEKSIVYRVQDFETDGRENAHEYVLAVQHSFILRDAKEQEERVLVRGRINSELELEVMGVSAKREERRIYAPLGVFAECINEREE